MSHRMLAIITALLTGCATATRVSVAPSELSTLAGMKPDEERSVRAVGRSDPVTVRGDDGVRLQTRSGTVPVASPGASDDWATIDSLQVDHRKVGLTWSVDDGDGRSQRTESAPLADVSSAEIQVKRANVGLTALAVVGIVVGAAVVVVGVGAIAVAVTHPCIGICGPLW